MDLSSAAAALSSLENLTYFALFILFIIEGPVLNFVATFAASLGYFNFFTILGLAFAGNIVGDVLYYTIGRLGNSRLTRKILRKKQETTEHKHTLAILHDKPFITLLLIKVTPLLPLPGLVYAGASKLKFSTYIWWICVISAVQVLAISIVGFYAGSFYGQIFAYFKRGLYLFAGLIIATIAFWFFMTWVSKKIYARLKETERKDK